MSGFEEKATKYARWLRERAAQKAETERTAAREEARQRRQVQEFFTLARRHGAPALPRYIARDAGFEGRQTRYERTDEVYVVACEWIEAVTRFDGPSWAVDADGTVHRPVSGGAIPSYTTGSPLGIVDRQFFITHDFSSSGPTGGFVDETLPAAAAALLEPAPLAQGMRTGVQDNGWIGYLAP
ncbi:hypothetical protein SAMN04487905_12014 [Actinopolyspora xinjiangensis]|uniref:Uncharacterized protein n=1 Tax=Actinopolyspora xinjiangensis TaxID=405564 RepID=A0A1H0X038_9ACTN|nr:hypothetical protein [Actinopolyspora xinjiangensis]SDP96354.1 hypothetical protein SAMN04487905_12014 [Actinopolyspora xinjiangensis]